MRGNLSRPVLEAGGGRRRPSPSYLKHHLARSEEVTIQFAEEPLARYGITHQRDHRHFRRVTPKRIFETPYQSPQPPLLELNPDDWRLAIELPTRYRGRRRRPSLVQAELFAPSEAVAGR